MTPPPEPTALNALTSLTEGALDRRDGMVVVGVTGAQGSGKSTLAAALHRRMTDRGVMTVTLSLDDFYHTRAERLRLAATVHPLLRTRGVPGTHDVTLALDTIAALARGEAAPLPRFDKACDDRCPPDEADRAPAATRLLLFEGWCLGARPQPAAALAEPINPLEAVEDRDAIWRHHVNAALAGDYAALWARIDALALLRAPDFASIAGWRQQQEAGLRAVAGDAPGVMSDAQVIHFVAHYERVTRQLLAELPGRADLVIDLDRDRAVTRIIVPTSPYCAATSSVPA